MAANFLKDRDIAIIAYSELQNRTRSGKTCYELAADVMLQLLDRTGLSHRDIDGVALTLALAETGNVFYSNTLVDVLGLQPRWLQVTDIGGCSPLGGLARAAAAIKSGMCNVVMCVHSDSTGALRHPGSFANYRTEFMEAAGYQGPVTAFGILSDAYDHKYGLKSEALGRLAVAQRAGAVVNENAVASLRKPITVEDYLSSRIITSPMRLLDCVMRCDGGSGIIVTTTARAKAMGVTKMVHPVAYSEISNYAPENLLAEPFESGFALIGPEVLNKAGLTVADLDMVQLYDDFLIAVMLQLEQIGFCGRGEGGDFLLGTDLSPTGKLPINTGGGQISCGQPGLAGGGINLTEALRQLFGEAGARQVHGAKNALVTGIGVIPYFRNWSSSNAMILEA